MRKSGIWNCISMALLGRGWRVTTVDVDQRRRLHAGDYGTLEVIDEASFHVQQLQTSHRESL